jgi:type IVB pilus formation R64 PilN family outer membrane protein
MTMLRTSLLRGAAATAVLLSLGACAARDEAMKANDVRHAEADRQQAALTRAANAAVSSPNVRRHPRIWLGDEGVRESNGESLPAKWEQPKGFILNSSKPLTIVEIASRIREITGIQTTGADLLLTWGSGQQGGGGQQQGGQNRQAPGGGGGQQQGGQNRQNASGGMSGGGIETGNPAATVPTVPGDIFGEFSVSATGTPYRDGTPYFPPIPVNHSGALSSFLNKIAAEYNIDWEYRAGVIRFIGFQTETFTLYSMNVGVESTSQITSAVTGGAGGASSGGAAGGAGAGGSSAQNGTTTTISAKYWDNLDATVKAMLPGDTIYAINRSAGTITVTGRRSALLHVREFVRDENRRLGRQVILAVKVLSVSRTHNDTYGLNLQAAFSNALTGISGGLTGPTPFSVSNIGNITAGVIKNTTAHSGFAQNFQGSSAVITALSEQGKVSLLTDTNVTTMNNQTAPVAVMQKQGYIKTVKTTSTTNAGTDTEIQTDEINTGFNMNITPRVFGNNDILLNYSINLSQLLDLADKTVGNSTVQLPKINARSFMQNVRLHSGDTIVLTGFEQMSNEADDRGTGTATNFLFGGGTKGLNQKDSIVIIITPIVLEDGKGAQAAR